MTERRTAASEARELICSVWIQELETAKHLEALALGATPDLDRNILRRVEMNGSRREEAVTKDYIKPWLLQVINCTKTVDSKHTLILR